MDNSTTQTNNLPSDLKEAIYSQKVYETLLSISKKFDLSIDQEGEMESETKLVMMGNTHPNKFVANLEERLEIDREKARLIAADINELVFKPVRLSLRKIHNIRDEGIMTAESTKATGTVEKLPPPPPPPAIRDAGQLPTRTAKNVSGFSSAPTSTDQTRTFPRKAFSLPFSGGNPSSAIPQTDARKFTVSGNKLTRTTDTSNEIAPPPPPKNYAVDPYREPPQG
ncbi:MAG: hypothetical protein A3A13_03160 [Candidatus Yanofskybacteria bacterium RIFCSPLOWO2_01_FULL_43_22]|uniref:Uncharacterized protein n=1 Tax=Candidatus Yanofskybacteria bacterium RIFCSPLOWO2_01_FULL_43_22 TaxID=1802695 RepID=A0A1F8GJ84_9BACT|nr:MAG: hypothetical protein A3A13_03160 [Candidatus Yanofskybacteria bacterium RIFCSPLOWO2_01_FULL_43_22]